MFDSSRKSLLVLLVLLGAALASGCSNVRETTLPNGLRVIVKEDHRSPVVVAQVWYRVGSIDEPEGQTGISHVLEHMMFKGTNRLKPNEFSRIIAEHGGRENAFTSHDYTAYFQQLEKSRLPISFELESDRMRNLKLDAAEFAKEIQVVMEERRLRTDDQPEALLGEKFMATAYRVHSYRNPVIGWMGDLEAMKVEYLQRWYERFYSPANAILVVVGDVKPGEVFRLARQHYGEVPMRPVDGVKAPAEPAQTEERRVRVSTPAELPQIVLGYHAPSLSSADNPWEVYALYVASGVLDGGNSARFPRELVRGSRIASQVNVDYSPIARAGVLFSIEATPSASHTVGELEQALRAQLAKLRDERVTEDELKRVKAQVVAGDVYTRDSVFYQAMQLGRYAAVGLDWRLADEFVKRIQAVTAEQVQAVAKKYFTDVNLTVAQLEPLPMKPGKRAPRVGGASHAR
jgi:zinc protease